MTAKVHYKKMWSGPGGGGTGLVAYIGEQEIARMEQVAIVYRTGADGKRTVAKHGVPTKCRQWMEEQKRTLDETARRFDSVGHPGMAKFNKELSASLFYIEEDFSINELHRLIQEPAYLETWLVEKEKKELVDKWGYGV